MNEAVDLRRLHVLRMVHECGTVTAAATALHLTPSAVSHQMRQLSREVGVALLERDGRRVRLTAAGRRLVVHADELHAGWERARADLAALADGHVGQLRMCAFPTAVAGVLAPAAERLAATTPGLQVRITEVDATAEGLQLLLSAETDIALVAPSTESPPLEDARFDQQPLLVEPLDLLVPAEHPLSGRRSAPLSDAAHDPWILAAPDSWDCYHLVASACAAAGFAPRVVHEAKTPVAVAALVARGLGVAAVPRLVPLPAHHAVRRVPLEGDPPPQRRILTCVRRGSDAQPAVARGLDALRAAAHELPPPLFSRSEAKRPDHDDEVVAHRHAG